MMKFYLLALAAGVLAIASPASASASVSETIEVCTSIEELAKVVMEGRQKNVSLSQAMSAAQKVDPSMVDLVTHIVLDAYSRPAYSSEEYKREAVNEFANLWAQACYEVWLPKV